MQRRSDDPGGDRSVRLSHVADEAAANIARRRLRRQGIIPIEPDCRVAEILDADELLVSIRRTVDLDRRQSIPRAHGGLLGDLYVTTRRLLHLGNRTVTIELDDIREAVISAESLLLVLDDGLGVAIGAPDPNLLRVEIAAARGAARARLEPADR